MGSCSGFRRSSTWKNQNQKAINDIWLIPNAKFNLEGGIRTLKNIEEWLELGVNRVIIGTAAISKYC